MCNLDCKSLPWPFAENALLLLFSSCDDDDDESRVPPFKCVFNSAGLEIVLGRILFLSSSAATFLPSCFAVLRLEEFAEEEIVCLE